MTMNTATCRSTSAAVAVCGSTVVLAAGMQHTVTSKPKYKATSNWHAPLEPAPSADTHKSFVAIMSSPRRSDTCSLPPAGERPRSLHWILKSFNRTGFNMRSTCSFVIGILHSVAR
eukprot:GHUV01032753.1.p1 GENE.GHUV01032753.1~~GHUV01032753.1.p1  ORF type:complete len:116 (+),score=10.89 GHUV01032753.1:599-946(+)